MKVAIVGGGLAGTACAYVLRQAGAEPVIYEAGAALASGASGNAAGLYNPRLSALRTAESDFYTAAFALALRVFPTLGDVDWNPCGALHLMTTEERAKRYAQTVENWGWPEEEMRIVNAGEASALAGVQVDHDALYIARSGSVSPRKLCSAYAKDVEVHLNVPVESLDMNADAIILACGREIRRFSDISVQAVRGQVTYVNETARSKDLKCALCYGGYAAPVEGGLVVGSTFQRWLDHSDILVEDDADNIAKLAEAVPGLGGDYQVTDHRAALRTTAKDHFPVAGHWRDNIYVSTAHGSHGILSSLMAAHLLADMILGRPLSVGKAVIQRLSPKRFG